MKWLRRLGIALGALVLLVALGAASVYAMSERKLSQQITIPDETPPRVSGDSAQVARGAHIASTFSGCVDCHASDLGGGVVIDDPAVGRISAPNLTTGDGGVLAKYDDAKLERAIRHGIGHDGRLLLIMPSKEYHNLSDSDVASVIAFIRSKPAVSRTHPPAALGPVLRTLWVAGKADAAAAPVIRHDAPHSATAPMDDSEATGAYIVQNGCAGCHGETLSGGAIPGAPPDWKPAANITPTGIGHYKPEDFARLLREGKRPDGSVVDTLMPIKATRNLTDLEVSALFKYLKTVAPRPYGGH